VALTYQSTGYTGADLSFTAAADNTISETFNKADGALGPNLTWTREVFTGPHVFQVSTNQCRFLTNTAGTFEDIQVPSPNITTPKMTMSCDVTNITRTGTGDYHISVGFGARYKTFSGGTDYRAYAVEIGRGTVIAPPSELWTLLIYRITSRDTPFLLASSAALLANVALPGTLTFTLDEHDISASFSHAGTDPTLTASTTDTVFTDGGIFLGGGNIINGTDSGSITIDNFAASGDDETVLTDDRGFLWVKNTDVASRTITVSVAGKTFRIAHPDSAVAIPSGQARLIGPFTERMAFNSGGRPTVAINYSSFTGVSAAAVRVP
jgi:hypothetical protein